MKKKSIFWLTLVLLSMFSINLFAQFAGGSGTEEDPWQVATAQHLNNVRYFLASHFIQTRDIDLDVDPWDDDEGWEPIGAFNEEVGNIPFLGTYDGGGYAIRGLTIYRPYEDFQGLFSSSGGLILNLGIEDIDVTGNDNVCGLVAVNAGIIDNCYVTGNVLGDENIAGLVAMNATINLIVEFFNEVEDFDQELLDMILKSKGAIIRNCSSSVDVSGSGIVAGLVAINLHEIESCFFTGTVSNDDITSGGLVGGNLGTISNSFNSGKISAMEVAGGLVGGNVGTVENSYSTGTVKGEEDVGGLIGLFVNGEVNNCYSIGKVKGEQRTGGLIGQNEDGTVSNSYWDIDKSGQKHSDGGKGRTKKEMTDPHSKNTYEGWDWSIWKKDLNHSKNQGYPYLEIP